MKRIYQCSECNYGPCEFRRSGGEYGTYPIECPVFHNKKPSWNEIETSQECFQNHREQMAFEIYKNIYQPNGFANKLSILAFKAADAFIEVSNERKNK
jgi:hypothetical protein